jgi:hypothetical protein
MPISRRVFMRQVVTVGPVAMAFWMERDLAWAADCAMPNVSQECSLPTPKPPVRFTPNEPKVVTRYSTLELNDPSRATQLKQLRDGVCLIRDLPPTDVLSWTKQIAQHCIHCARSNADNIHYNWQFLPWHRGLLYFIERAMRKLGKMEDMRLAYWNWENAAPASRTVPAIYAPSGQPLYWANRHLTVPLTDNQVNVQPLLAVPDFATFGGTATQVPTPTSTTPSPRATWRTCNIRLATPSSTPITETSTGCGLPGWPPATRIPTSKTPKSTSTTRIACGLTCCSTTFAMRPSSATNIRP